MALPGFLNQLLLLLNSGIVLEEAMQKIGEGYRHLPKTQANDFTDEFCRICTFAETGGEHVVAGFYRLGHRSGNKALSRISSMLMENLDKGTDLWDKLAEEGEALWQERKRLALEKMRTAESKMSFPLGLMLLSLLLLTAGPAMMSL